MTAKWGSCVFLACALALLGGCKSSQPNLKPASTPDKLVPPPMETRYETTGYPKMAFDAPTDPTVQAGGAAGQMGAGSPRSSPTGGSSMGGMPGR